MKNAIRLALLTLLAVPVLVASGCGGSEEVPSGAVAVVNGTGVPRADLDALMDQARKSYAAQKQSFPKAGTAEFKSLQEQAVAYLVLRVGDQEAEEARHHGHRRGHREAEQAGACADVLRRQPEEARRRAEEAGESAGASTARTCVRSPSAPRSPLQ